MATDGSSADTAAGTQLITRLIIIIYGYPQNMYLLSMSAVTECIININHRKERQETSVSNFPVAITCIIYFPYYLLLTHCNYT